MDSKVWVGIVDGSELFSRALVTLVTGEGIAETVMAYQDLGLATGKIEDGGRGGLLIVDLGLPDCQGAATVHELRIRFPDLRVLVGVPIVSRDLVFGCLMQGAHGCFFRTQSYAEIVAAVRAVALGEIYVPPSVSVVEGNSFLTVVSRNPVAPETMATDNPSPQRSRAGTKHNLSGRQNAVLDLILQGFSNKAIARELTLAEGTVKVHVNSLYRVLNVHSRLQAVTRVMEPGRM